MWVSEVRPAWHCPTVPFKTGWLTYGKLRICVDSGGLKGLKVTDYDLVTPLRINLCLFPCCSMAILRINDCINVVYPFGEQWWCSGEKTRLPARVQILASSPYHLWVEFVVGSLPCSERFFSGYSGFPLSLKTNTSKFQVDLERTDKFQRVPNCFVGKQITNYNFNFFFLRDLPRSLCGPQTLTGVFYSLCSCNVKAVV